MDKLLIVLDDKAQDWLDNIYRSENSQQALEFVLEQIAPQKKKKLHCWEGKNRQRGLKS